MRNPDFVTVPVARRGMLLAELDGQNVLFSLLPLPEDGLFLVICGIHGYETAEANKYFDGDKTQEFPCFYYEHGDAWMCDDEECPKQVFLDCHDENADYMPVSAGLYTYNNVTGEFEEGSEGLLMMHLTNRNKKVDADDLFMGTVCDNHFTYDSYFDDHAADLICQQLGYTLSFVNDWGSLKKKRRLYSEINSRRKRHTHRGQ